MAVDVCSSFEPFISPRISFSHDLNNQSSETATTSTVVATSTTFDFCITSNLDQPITSADELFFNGVLLPTQIKKQPKIICPTSKILVSENEDVQRKRLKELLCDNDEEQDNSSSRSFWRFMRTTSLNSNSNNTKRPKRLFRSLSLKRMLRSNSADSALNPSCNEAIKVVEKGPSTLIQTPPVHHSSNEPNSSTRFVTKKISDGGYDRGKKINHVVNIPATYNRNLFGFGSLFCNSKTRNTTK